MHQLLRQFAAEELDGQPAEANDAVLRGAILPITWRSWSGWAKASTRHGQGKRLKEIGFNIENMRCAWQLALEMGNFDILQKGLQPLYHYLRIQGLFHEALRIFGHAATSFWQLYEQDSEKGRVQELLSGVAVASRPTGLVAGRSDAAIELLREGLDQLEQAARDLRSLRAAMPIWVKLCCALGDREEPDHC